MQEIVQKIGSLNLDPHLQNQSNLLVYNSLNLLHTSTKKHPECPQRISETITHLQQQLFRNTNFIDISQADFKPMSFQHLKSTILETHTQNYFDFVEGMWYEGIKKPQMYINLDTYFMKDTFQAACEAVKSVLIALDLILEQKYKHCFSLIRPPGHHSGLKSQPHGFSFFNNLAIAVNTYIKKSSKRVAIIDWDAHHGEGTQNLFYKKEDVLFISIHRYDKGTFFPHIIESGSQFVGADSGKGFNINIGWNLPSKPKGESYHPHQTCGDQEYATCFRRIIIPILKQYHFHALFISCGFDSAQGDPIANLNITKYGYMHMTRQLMKLQKTMFFILEGGYNLEVLQWGVESVIRTLEESLIEKDLKEIRNLEETLECNEIGREGIEETIKNVKEYWPVLDKDL